MKKITSEELPSENFESEKYIYFVLNMIFHCYYLLIRLKYIK